MDNLKSEINLTPVCGRKPQSPEKTHLDIVSLYLRGF